MKRRNTSNLTWNAYEKTHSYALSERPLYGTSIWSVEKGAAKLPTAFNPSATIVVFQQINTEKGPTEERSRGSDVRDGLQKEVGPVWETPQMTHSQSPEGEQRFQTPTATQGDTGGNTERERPWSQCQVPAPWWCQWQQYPHMGACRWRPLLQFQLGPVPHTELLLRPTILVELTSPDSPISEEDQQSHATPGGDSLGSPGGKLFVRTSRDYNYLSHTTSRKKLAELPLSTLGSSCGPSPLVLLDTYKCWEQDLSGRAQRGIEPGRRTWQPNFIYGESRPHGWMNS